MAPAGPHGAQHLTNKDLTRRTGMLPGPGNTDPDQ
jgi:hypothetical protein